MNQSVILQIFDRLLAMLRGLRSTLAGLWAFAGALLGAFFPRRGPRKIKPWMLIRRAKGKANGETVAASEADVRRLLERMRDLEDTSSLTDRAAGFSATGSDFFADPRHVEQIVAELVRQNPPFLHVAREMPAEDEGDSKHRDVEYILRDSEILVTEPYNLLIPRVGVEYLESRRPPGYPILRAARSLSDLRSAPLLYQALPDSVLFSRYVEGSIPVLAYREERKYLIFEPEERMVTRKERRRAHVPVEIETGGEGHSARLMYMLFDRSTSLVRNCSPRGLYAVIELAIAVSMVRADLGRPHARYYFRAFADRLDPLPKDPPLCATSVAQKDYLVERLFKTNFSGEATNVVEALETAMDDIEHIVETGELGPGVRPRIGLLTDGRATIYRNTGARLKRLGIELDTILIGKEASRNPELTRISSTISIVDPEQYLTRAA